LGPFGASFPFVLPPAVWPFGVGLLGPLGFGFSSALLVLPFGPRLCAGSPSPALVLAFSGSAFLLSPSYLPASPSPLPFWGLGVRGFGALPLVPPSLFPLRRPHLGVWGLGLGLVLPSCAGLLVPGSFVLCFGAVPWGLSVLGFGLCLWCWPWCWPWCLPWCLLVVLAFVLS